MPRPSDHSVRRKASRLGTLSGRLGWALLSSLALAFTGCSSVFAPLLPDMRTPADRAREIESHCKWVNDDSVAQLLDPTAVDRVEPELSYVQSGNDRRANLMGARVYLRPLPGLSAESMTRTLECHQARTTLGQVQAREGDPYVLPGRWLDVDAVSHEDEFAIRIRASDISDARLVLARARSSFASPRL
jgi:hypothetical protein